MRTILKTRGDWLFCVACVAVLAISAAVVGCSNEDAFDSEGVVVRNPQQTRPTPKSTPWPATVDTTSVISEPETVVATIPEPQREVTYEEAEAAFHARQYTVAADLFTQYTERKSDNPWGYYMLGLSQWKAGEHASAEEALRRALELDPDHVKSRLNLSRVLLAMGKPEDALTEIREALVIDPESNVAYRLKGRVFHAIGQKKQAVDAYRRAIQIDDQDVWAMNNLGLIYIEEGLFGKALPPLARAVEISDDVAMFQNNLGMALESNGYFRAAEEVYQFAVDVDETYEKAVLNLTRVAAVVEEFDLEPVDLAAIAASFVDEIEAWRGSTASGETPITLESDAVVASDQTGSRGSGVNSTVVSDADSTESNPKR